MSAFREAPRRLACPRCGENLEPLSNGVEICARCEGVWLPTSAVERAFGTPYWPRGPSAWWRRELECPACVAANVNRMLTPVLAGQIVVDRCPDHGEWLDAGELGRLLDAPRDIELEAFYERLRPDGERARRTAELELYRAQVEADQARIRAEREAARALEQARAAALAEEERRVLLVKQRAALQLEYADTERGVRMRERELAKERDGVERHIAQLDKLQEAVTKCERDLAKVRAELTDLERQIADAEAALKA